MVKLLSVLVVVVIHLLFATAVVQGGGRLVLLYFVVLAFYGALYFRRRLWLRHERGGLYRGLGYTAVMLGASLLALLFNAGDLGAPLPLAMIGVVRLVAALTAAYYLYRVVVLHLEEEAPAQVQLHNMLPPV